MTPDTVLFNLWKSLAPGSLGALIVWNARYHLDPAHGPIPTFDRQWAITREPYNRALTKESHDK